MRASARIHEHWPTVTIPEDPPSALVHEAMVMAAQQDRVAQTRVPAVRPVRHVMGVGETRAAPWKAAAAISGLEGTAERGRDRARAPAHIQHRAIRRVGDPDQPGVAAEPTGRFR